MPYDAIMRWESEGGAIAAELEAPDDGEADDRRTRSGAPPRPAPDASAVELDDPEPPPPAASLDVDHPADAPNQ